MSTLNAGQLGMARSAPRGKAVVAYYVNEDGSEYVNFEGRLFVPDSGIVSFTTAAGLGLKDGTTVQMPPRRNGECQFCSIGKLPKTRARKRR
jgi:hypothetical protein